MNGKRVLGWVVVQCLVAAALFLPCVLWPGARLVSPRVLDAANAVLRLSAMILTTVHASRCAALLEPGAGARRGWALLAFAFGCFAVGQVGLSSYPVFLGVVTPLPSWGDLFDLGGSVALVVALFTFVHAYATSGFPLGSAISVMWPALVATAVLALLGYSLLGPIAAAPKPLGELVVNLGYPILDFVSLVATVALIRIMIAFRGGRVWLVWGTILAGIAFFSASDILFSYQTSMGMKGLSRLADLGFIVAFSLVAYGVVQQRALLES